jgi:hypothetical protein
MLFSLPDNTTSGIIGFAFDFFNATKVYIFLAIGVGLGLLIVEIIYDLFFSYGAEVKTEAKRRILKMEAEEEEEEFEEDVGEAISDIMLEE